MEDRLIEKTQYPPQTEKKNHTSQTVVKFENKGNCKTFQREEKEKGHWELERKAPPFLENHSTGSWRPTMASSSNDIKGTSNAVWHPRQTPVKY